MEQNIYQEEYRKLFSEYLTNPDGKNQADLQSIKELLDKFPFCQSLHFIYAAGLKNDPEKFDAQLTRLTSLVPQHEMLHQTIYHPEKFIVKEHLLSELKNGIGIKTEIPEEDREVEGFASESSGTGTAEIEVADIETPEKIEGENVESQESESPVSESSGTGTAEIEVADIEIPEEVEDENAESLGTGTAEIEVADNEIPEEREDENAENPALETPETDTAEIEITDNEDLESQEALIPDNIASADYFRFNQSVADPLKEDVNSPLEKIHLKNSDNTREVAKYDDYTMPYTFLWWLNKTRKEHAGTYQPYVNFKLDTTRPIKRNVSSELNQQIIENIFHLQPVLSDNERKTPSNTIEFELKRKDDDIIEKFIKGDPQIRPMPAEKISTENKARKSAEDKYDMVSETLARIYTDQMLYHKAIDTYKKLSLKFPEKNAYFADQILELEKKIN